MTVNVIDPDAGGGEDYTDILLWAQQNRDLVSAQDTEELLVRPTAGSACVRSDGELMWNAWSTSPDSNIQIRPYDETYKHRGYWDTERARIVVDSATSWHRIFASDNAILFEDMQLALTGGNTSGIQWAGPPGEHATDPYDENQLFELHRCVVHRDDPSTAAHALTHTGAAKHRITNCVFSGAWQIGFDRSYAGASNPCHPDSVLYHCTFHLDTSDRILGVAQGAEGYQRGQYKNLLVINEGAGACWHDGGIPAPGVYDDIYTSDATSPDGASHQNAAPAFVAPASYDYRMDDSEGGVYPGQDLSADAAYPLAVDWEGDDRVNWDAGFDEAASDGDSVFPAHSRHALHSPEIQLIQGHVLSMGDAHHGHTAQAVDLAQAAVLAVAGALHGHTAEGVALTQAQLLDVAGSVHGHTVQAVVLTQAALLDVRSAWHAHTAQAPDVTTETVLSVGDAHHGHRAGGVHLVQAHVLTVGAAHHGHTVQPVTLSEALLLAVEHALHGHVAGGVQLTQGHVLAVAGAAHALTSDLIDGLPTDAVLVVSDSVHAHVAQQVQLIDPLATVDLGDRIFVVQAEDRVYVVAPETRIGRVH